MATYLSLMPWMDMLERSVYLSGISLGRPRTGMLEGFELDRSLGGGTGGVVKAAECQEPQDICKRKSRNRISISYEIELGHILY